MNIAIRSQTASELRSQEKLFTAISILQAHILAEDTALSPENMFGVNHLRSNGLEMVERLLQDLVPEMDEWEPSSDTEILKLFRRRQKISAAASVYDPHSDDPDAEMDRLFWNEADEVESQMMALPSTCAADFAAKAITDTVQGGMFPSWERSRLWKEARELTGTPLEADIPIETEDEACRRLAQFAEWTETEAPKNILDEEGAPTDELLDYCKREHLSLDWLLVGDERSLVLRLRNKTEIAA